MKRIQGQIASVVDTMEELTENRAKLHREIENQLDAVIDAAHQRKRDLKQELNRVVQQKMRKLMTQKRELQDTQRALEECYMINDTTFDALERKTKILEEAGDFESFHPATTPTVELVLDIDAITECIAVAGSIAESATPPPADTKQESPPTLSKLRGLSVVAPDSDTEPESAHSLHRVRRRPSSATTLIDVHSVVVAGFIRRVLPSLHKEFVKVPAKISWTVLNYYFQSQLDSILEDEALKTLSLDLVNRDDFEFLNFVERVLNSRLKEQIWKKCDEEGTGTIDERKFMYFWMIPVTLFKVSEFQRLNDTKAKPELDNAEIKRECKHLATWIIWRFGTLRDGRFSFSLQREGYTERVMEFLQSYADAKGKVVGWAQ